MHGRGRFLWLRRAGHVQMHGRLKNKSEWGRGMEGRHRSRRIAMYFVTTSLIVCGGEAFAQRRSFNINSGNANATIPVFAKQSGLQIIVAADRLRGVRTPAIVGAIDVRVALSRLLQSTNLVIAVDNGSIVVLKSRPAPALHKATMSAVAAVALDDPPRGEASARPNEAPPPEPVGEREIIVTGSRIATTGYSQPTPVMIVSETQIERDAKASIGDTIREMPAVGSSSSPNNGVGANNIVGGVTGLDTVNLRHLGVNRTLVLLDSQRVVQSNITGVVDLGTMPTMLVQRVEVVTGGASAAWGSDAVAGVVNLVLNKAFEGVRISLEGGESDKFDHKSYRLQAAAGLGFADDRGRVIVAANYLNSPDTIFANQRSWNSYRNLIDNPAYTPTNNEPRLIHADNVGLSQATNGGLIQGPDCLVPEVDGVCARPNPLLNIRFVGPNATPVSFDPGIVSGPISAFGDAETEYPAMNNLAVAFRTLNLFGYTHFDLTENLRASIQVNYGESRSKNNSTPATRFGTLSIKADNPFLPDAIRQDMGTLGLDRVWVVDDGNIPNAQFADAAFAVFMGAAGTVTVDRNLGDVEASGMQFLTDGYVIAGDAISLAGSQATIRVGDGTAAGAGTSATITSELTGPAQLVKSDLGTLVLSGNNSYTGGTAIKGGTLAVSADVNLGDAAGRLTFNGGTLQTTADLESDRAVELTGAGTLLTDDGTTLSLTGLVSGAGGLVKDGTGVLVLAATNSYAGGTTVTAGTLFVNGDQSAAAGLTSVDLGATLGGTGVIGGNVALADGARLNPGGVESLPGTLTIGGSLSLASGSTLAMQFGEANAVGGSLNDLIEVGGDLVLDGTLDVSIPAGGTFGPGIYRVINYGGALTDNGLDLGVIPAGSTSTVQTSIAGQVNLVNTDGLLLNFWDGNAGPKFNNAIDGGDGVWQNSTGNDNWTDANGTVNAAYADEAIAIFAGTGGTVTIDNSLGDVRASSMQFAADGYEVRGETLTLVGPQSTIRVGDGYQCWRGCAGQQHWHAYCRWRLCRQWRHT